MDKHSPMKRSSSSLDQTARREGADDVPHQMSYAKVARQEELDLRSEQTSMDPPVEGGPSNWSPRHSTILGSFYDPPTYVIHLLDTHLTLQQSFQLCSLFGRIRLHGHVLRAGTYYSIYNYRTNSSLPIELISSHTGVTPCDVASIIPNVQLAENALSHVQQKGGDILVIRREPKNDSLFNKTIREHRLYSKWFAETYGFFVGDSWRQMERDLQIRPIETTEPTAVVARDEFVSTADRIINRWLTETTEDFPFIVLICGEKDMGKSTFTRYVINRAMNHIDPIYNVTYMDCDIGQCEFTMGGCLSYVNLTTPLLGPPCSHMQSSPKPDHLLCYGQVSPQAAPVRYLQYIDQLRQLWNRDYRQRNPNRSMVVINTMGWGTGLGLELLKETICMCCPNVVVQLTDNMSSDRTRMPDVTLEWLMQQPVFIPYRRTIGMNSRRRPDYDGQLNYEYIKLQSTTIMPTTHTGTSKLRPRDHRLLATWSYFFSSDLRRISLPWSQFVHVSLLDSNKPNLLPDSLEKSIVGLCSSENIEQLRSTAVHTNGIHQVLDHQDQIFECFGFGWIESCDKATHTLEIYTPVNIASSINLLVSGAFDTPDEFRQMFSRVAVE